MALPTTVPITLDEIQDEFSAVSLEDASDIAGLTLPTAITDFLGLSSTPPFSGSWAVTFDASNGNEANFVLDIIGLEPGSTLTALQGPLPGSDSEPEYGGVIPGLAFVLTADSNGIIALDASNFNNNFWWPAPRGNYNYFEMTLADGTPYTTASFAADNVTGFESYFYTFP